MLWENLFFVEKNTKSKWILFFFQWNKSTFLQHFFTKLSHSFLTWSRQVVATFRFSRSHHFGRLVKCFRDCFVISSSSLICSYSVSGPPQRDRVVRHLALILNLKWIRLELFRTFEIKLHSNIHGYDKHYSMVPKWCL